MTFLLLALFSLQAPGDGWALSQAPPREVKRVYWDLFQTTEVWVRLLPESPDGEPPLVNLIFQAFFPGRAKRNPYSGLPRWPKGEPERLTVRAQILPLTVLRELSLRFVIDGNTLDLTGLGREYRHLGCLGPGTDCAPNGVEAEIEPSVLQSMITAQTVRGHALGLPIELREADQLALAEFAKRTGLSAENEEIVEP
jgi:hypothetical protein